MSVIVVAIYLAIGVLVAYLLARYFNEKHFAPEWALPSGQEDYYVLGAMALLWPVMVAAVAVVLSVFGIGWVVAALAKKGAR